MFGDDVQVRFRPDFFPFVEPGVDYAISSPRLFGGKWVELGGAGLIHPNILEAHGIDPEEFSGFAFGLGVERIPMMASGIDDLDRACYVHDQCLHQNLRPSCESSRLRGGCPRLQAALLHSL